MLAAEGVVNPNYLSHNLGRTDYTGSDPDTSEEGKWKIGREFLLNGEDLVGAP